MNTIRRTFQRPRLSAFALVATCLSITLVVHGSESVDSGWTTPRSTTVLSTARPENAQIRLAKNHILEQGRVPLLLAPAQPRPVVEAAEDDAQEQAPTEQPTTEFQNAEQAKIVFGSADGWRPAHLPTESPRQSPSTPELAPPGGRRFTPIASTVAPPITPVPATGANESEPTSTADHSPRTAAETTTDSSQQNARVESNAAASSSADDTNSAADARPPIAVEQPAPPLPPLSQNMKNLRAKVRRVIKSYYTRPLNSRDNDPWEMMHGMLAYGVQSQVRQGGPQGKPITLVGWLCYSKPAKGMTLLYLTPENELRAKQGVGLQGHMGQFLAMLAQCQVSPNYPIRVRSQEFAISDLIEAEKKTCYPKTELTFKLIALMHYLDTDATWVNDQGQSWDIPRLIREELAQPIRGAACGGTHRLSGLSLAARTRVRRGEPLDGEYLRASEYVEKYEKYAFQLQNRDGSLSTEWFRGRGSEDSIDRRVKTTGHILEWLCYSVDDNEVRSPQMFRAANYLSSLLASNFDHEWEVGPLGHAIHALRLYDERVFQPYDNQDNVAKKAPRKSARRPSPSWPANTANF